MSDPVYNNQIIISKHHRMNCKQKRNFHSNSKISVYHTSKQVGVEKHEKDVCNEACSEGFQPIKH